MSWIWAGLKLPIVRILGATNTFREKEFSELSGYSRTCGLVRGLSLVGISEDFGIVRPLGLSGKLGFRVCRRASSILLRYLPFMQRGNLCSTASSISSGLNQLPSLPITPFLGSGMDWLFSLLHRKVFDSTRATSAGFVLVSQLKRENSLYHSIIFL